MKPLLLVTALLALPAIATPAQAGRERFAIDDPTYRAECASCHVAYPPQLLPAQSWRALMRGLDKHFGSDASLDAKTAAQIEAYLAANASPKGLTGTPPLRISETAWFKREHDEIGSAVWQRKAIGSASNCAACHRQADRGDFSERNIRIPK